MELVDSLAPLTHRLPRRSDHLPGGEAQWIGRGAARAFMIVSLVVLLLLVIRGLHFPNPKALSTPWYTSPGFIVGIPAVPFIIPYLFGVVLLRRAGKSDSAPGSPID